MATFNISLSDSVTQFIEEQVALGRYDNPSDYIEALLLKEQKQVNHKALESLLHETLESDDLPCMTQEWWQQKRSQILKQLRTEQ